MLFKRLNRFQWLVLLVASLAVAVLYLLSAFWQSGVGFPLDDAWIHQTYARNLAFLGEWAFRAGQPSSGSSSPLWTLLLALGYILHLPYLAWTWFLGWLVLLALAASGEIAFRDLVDDYRPRWPWVGLALALAWHHVWAAFSGMETLLFAWGVFIVLIQLLYPRRGAARLGLLVGLMVWLRPDGITLAGPVLMTFLLDDAPWRVRWQRVASFLLTLGVPLAFYALFNLFLDGALLPNTFYAKQMEYSILRHQPLWFRLLEQYKMLLVGAGVLLFPAWLIWLGKAWQKRAWAAISLALWQVGYLALFALRLPVTYQHGRYQMPVMPLFIWLGLLGLWYLNRVTLAWMPFLLSLWRTSVAAVLAAFCLLGAWAYGVDVGIINRNMVDVALWVSDNIPPDDLVAAHDIGALGYFAPQPLLDLAGLVSPEVIPLLGDEDALRQWLDEQGADVLVVPPNEWYTLLPQGKERLYCARALSESAACVYRWR